MLLLNGELLAHASLPLPNRGLHFGDGFFETMVWENNRLRLAAGHQARMQQAAAALHLTLPPALASAEALAAAIAPLAKAHGWPVARIRLQLWRSGGGLYAPETDTVEWLATAVPYEPNETPVQQADFALETHSMPSPLSFCKGPQAWLYVRAAHERQQRGLDEIILCDAAGNVAEAGTAAIFWEKNGVLFTPSLASGCVAGVRRAQILHAAQQAGIEHREGLFSKAELLAADSVFTANAAAVRAVSRIGTRQYELPAARLKKLTAFSA